MVTSALNILIIYCIFGASLVAQGERIRLQCSSCRRYRLDLWVGKIPWSKSWQPTPVLLPGKFHGQRSLEGCSPQGHKESDMTEATWHTGTQHKEQHEMYLLELSTSLLFVFQRKYKNKV